MAYDPYADLPKDLRPTWQDTLALTEAARLIKECVRLRHDFHTAVQVGDIQQGIQQAFTPAILGSTVTAPERHLKGPPAWESAFASITPESRRTTAAFAEEHRQNALEVRSRTMQVTGNSKLRDLVKERIDALLPEIGYSDDSGRFLRRLRKDDRSVLDAFHPLGVGDVAVLIKLLINRPPATYYYW